MNSITGTTYNRPIMIELQRAVVLYMTNDVTV